MELTVLMPCLNEARTLQHCIEQIRSYLDRSGIDGEILVADNGSTDGSQALAQSLRARVVDIPVKGYGAALRGGIEAARGRFVIMGDSDGSYDFAHLDDFIEHLRQGCDLVVGNRFQGGIAPGAMPALHRYLGNPVLSFIGRLFFAIPLRDFHCGLRGFRRDRILGLGLQTDGMEFASEMIVKASLHGLRMREVPTTLSPDGRDRPPHLRSWRDGWRHLRFLLLFSPRWLFFYPGMLLLALGLAGMVALMPGGLRVAQVVFDVHTLLYCAAATMMGFQMTLFSLMARVAGAQLGMLPQNRLTRWMFQSFRLEVGMAAALVLMACSAWLALGSVQLWQQVSFQSLDPAQVMRQAVPAVTLAVTGVEVLVFSFFITFLQFSHARQR